jgi:hypothetical protein
MLIQLLSKDKIGKKKIPKALYLNMIGVKIWEFCKPSYCLGPRWRQLFQTLECSEKTFV